MKRRGFFAACLLAVLASIVGSVRLATAQTAAGGEDVLAALLAEVRGLRSAIEQMAAAGPRIQLALGRLQIQEERVNAMIRRHDELSARILSQEQQIDMLNLEIEAGNEALERAVAAEVRAQIEQQSAQLKKTLERVTAGLERLQSEGVQIASEVAAEQSRRVELNAQLEALEESLRAVGKAR
jgi:chromosome segregation ATPase